MTRLRGLVLTAPLVLCGHLSFGDVLTVDLARQAPGSAVTLPAGAFPEISIRIINRAPTLAYSISVEDSIVLIPQLTMPPPGAAQATRACQDLLDLADLLWKAADEQEVSKRVAGIQAGIDQCQDPALLLVVRARVASTTLDVPRVHRVLPGHQLTITVSRPSGNKTLTWVTIVKGEDRGMWLTTYGATVTDNGDERFYVQEANGRFTITPEAKATGVKVIPSVFFTWLPRAHQAQDFSWGLTGGLGIEDDAPAFFVGGGLTYNWNLGIVAGVSLVKETRLNGKYTSGQELSQSLSEDQLLKTVFQPRLFVGVTFRFGSNPFGSKGSTTNAAAPAAKKKDGNS